MMDVIRSHSARVRAADPLAGDQDELPDWPERTIRAHGGVGVVTVDQIDPGSVRASWSPLIVHRLQARVSGPDPEAALGALVDRWLAGLRGTGPGHSLTVSWPSRDTAPVRALATRGFGPISVTAVRPLRQRSAPVPGVRPATAGDLDALVKLYEGLVAYDAQFGWVAVRPSTPARLRELVAGEVLPLEWCWVAEAGGRVAGCLIMQPPERSGWIARSLNAGPAAYLSVMYVDPSVRGRGMGTALTETAHGHAAASGAAWSVLHHALPNPLSTPFWARRGYRPLLTQWVRHLQ
ncbi:GNAT family N-acetyltransferase [Nonomuraea sp. K274]|uniref:GNAT family N-acetyltransferase n=1 Tax=Nonomuraea cypriaca TaxID=1187855 RepID=A0A931A7Y4_9ACTN|nr:GNAT family N-acetyltransferase [Nonomuraea cypriaca]MBF8186675.1 GNAT family N-acetyltransferase [Nonomuraea cypriaca]